MNDLGINTKTHLDRQKQTETDRNRQRQMSRWPTRQNQRHSK